MRTALDSIKFINYLIVWSFFEFTHWRGQCFWLVIAIMFSAFDETQISHARKFISTSKICFACTWRVWQRFLLKQAIVIIRLRWLISRAFLTSRFYFRGLSFLMCPLFASHISLYFNFEFRFFMTLGFVLDTKLNERGGKKSSRSQRVH